MSVSEITMKQDQTRVAALLTETVTLLCKNGLHYERDLRIQGVVGITLDGSEIFLVHINETISEKTSENREALNLSENLVTSNAAERLKNRSDDACTADANSSEIDLEKPDESCSNQCKKSTCGKPEQYMNSDNIDTHEAIENAKEDSQHDLPNHSNYQNCSDHLNSNGKRHSTMSEFSPQSMRDSKSRRNTRHDGAHMPEMSYKKVKPDPDGDIRDEVIEIDEDDKCRETDSIGHKKRFNEDYEQLSLDLDRNSSDILMQLKSENLFSNSGSTTDDMQEGTSNMHSRNFSSKHQKNNKTVDTASIEYNLQMFPILPNQGARNQDSNFWNSPVSRFSNYDQFSEMDTVC